MPALTMATKLSATQRRYLQSHPDFQKGIADFAKILVDATQTMTKTAQGKSARPTWITNNKAPVNDRDVQKTLAQEPVLKQLFKMLQQFTQNYNQKAIARFIRKKELYRLMQQYAAQNPQNTVDPNTDPYNVIAMATTNPNNWNDLNEQFFAAIAEALLIDEIVEGQEQQEQANTQAAVEQQEQAEAQQQQTTDDTQSDNNANQNDQSPAAENTSTAPQPEYSHDKSEVEKTMVHEAVKAVTEKSESTFTEVMTHLLGTVAGSAAKNENVVEQAAKMVLSM